jgi:hypothetical protein
MPKPLAWWHARPPSRPGITLTSNHLVGPCHPSGATDNPMMQTGGTAISPVGGRRSGTYVFVLLVPWYCGSLCLGVSRVPFLAIRTASRFTSVLPTRRHSNPTFRSLGCRAPSQGWREPATSRHARPPPIPLDLQATSPPMVPWSLPTPTTKHQNATHPTGNNQKEHT